MLWIFFTIDFVLVNHVKVSCIEKLHNFTEKVNWGGEKVKKKFSQLTFSVKIFDFFWWMELTIIAWLANEKNFRNIFCNLVRQFFYAVHFYMIRPFSVYFMEIQSSLQVVIIVFWNAIFVTDIPIQMDFSIQKIGLHGFIFMHGVSPIILGKLNIFCGSVQYVHYIIFSRMNSKNSP